MQHDCLSKLSDPPNPSLPDDVTCDAAASAWILVALVLWCHFRLKCLQHLFSPVNSLYDLFEKNWMKIWNKVRLFLFFIWLTSPASFHASVNSFVLERKSSISCNSYRNAIASEIYPLHYQETIIHERNCREKDKKNPNDFFPFLIRQQLIASSREKRFHNYFYYN